MLPLAFACNEAPAPAEPAPAEPAAADHHGHDHDHHGHSHDHAGHDHGGSMPMEHGHSFADAEKWAGIFDAADRDAWQKPAELVAGLAIEPGMTVADIGAGTGYFNSHLAGAVGAEGKVIAIDSEPEMVAWMNERLAKEPLAQVEVRQAAGGDAKLTAGEADLILMVNTYHHVPDRSTYFGALSGALKDGGRLAIVDYKPGDSPHGPPAAMRIAPDTVKAELEAVGWTQQGTLELLPEQYVLIYGAASGAPAPAEPAAEPAPVEGGA